eukprot:gb/GEZJ01004626.1/.p1 GENE.gb/GEZJ01004626.1/~~gb/GEZJ01004626.1/.p1  ORF type:complete len:143 (+),score=15.10 gb/GEZJ01004626.1/:778-1206(+)
MKTAANGITKLKSQQTKAPTTTVNKLMARHHKNKPHTPFMIIGALFPLPAAVHFVLPYVGATIIHTERGQASNSSGSCSSPIPWVERRGSISVADIVDASKALWLQYHQWLLGCFLVVGGVSAEPNCIDGHSGKSLKREESE